MSHSRNERRLHRKATTALLRENRNCRASVMHAANWLATLNGFEGSTTALREAVVEDLRSRCVCAFKAFDDPFGLPCMKLVDAEGRELSFGTLFAAKLRVTFKGGHHGRNRH